MAFTSLCPASNAQTLTAYYTFDDLTTGIQNQGTDGATSNLTVPTSFYAPATAPTQVGGIIGSGALSFNGTGNILATVSAGNAAADLTAYPFSMSLWMDGSAVGSAAMGVAARPSFDKYTYVGTNASGQAVGVRRNNTAATLNSGSSVVTGWHHVTMSFDGASSASIFVDGKLISTDATNIAFASLTTLSFGAIIRSTNQYFGPYTGLIDDPGLFVGSLDAMDVSLINGLGTTSGLGLNWLDEALTLSSSSIGATASIGSYTWQRVTGLSGTTGDYGGTAAGGNAYIVIDALGNGIQVVPEPAPPLLLALGALALVARRRSSRK